MKWKTKEMNPEEMKILEIIIAEETVSLEEMKILEKMKTAKEIILEIISNILILKRRRIGCLLYFNMFIMLSP